jgi:fibronectin-binding autotransporter adhesin
VNTSVVVKNVAPSLASFNGPAVTVPGLTSDFSSAFSDPGQLDTHTALINWGDGSSSPGALSEVQGSGTAGGSHVYTSAGTYTVTLTVTDKDGAAKSINRQITVKNAALLPDTLNPGQQALYIGGSNADDTIEVKADKTGKITYDIHSGRSEWTGNLTGSFSRIEVFGLAGNDNIEIDGDSQAPAWLYGGAGNDNLTASDANCILIGGTGNDSLIGGKGRNLLIGGSGLDVLSGKGGDDLLIAGTTDFDANEAALNAVMLEWARTDATYRQRVDHITGAVQGGKNGSFALNSATVHDDGQVNSLIGGSGNDLYFAGVWDLLLGKKKDEVVIKV